MEKKNKTKQKKKQKNNEAFRVSIFLRIREKIFKYS